MKKEENIGVNDLEPFVLSLEKLGEKKLALQVLDAFAKQSKQFFQYENLAKCYFKLKDYNKSINYGEKALALSKNGQQSYIIRSNLINVYNHANYPEKALTYVTCNERLASGDTEVAFEKAYALYLLNRRDEAEKILTDLLSKSEEFDEETVTKIKFNLGTYLLYRDKFQQGMQNFIFEGAKMRIWDNTETIFSRNQKLRDIPFWAGSPEVKNLIIYAEAGIGDDESSRIGIADIFASKDQQSACDETYLLSSFDHSCQPVYGTVRIAPSDRFYKCGDDIVVLFTAFIIKCHLLLCNGKYFFIGYLQFSFKVIANQFQQVVIVVEYSDSHNYYRQ